MRLSFQILSQPIEFIVHHEWRDRSINQFYQIPNYTSSLIQYFILEFLLDVPYYFYCLPKGHYLGKIILRLITSKLAPKLQSIMWVNTDEQQDILIIKHNFCKFVYVHNLLERPYAVKPEYTYCQFQITKWYFVYSACTADSTTFECTILKLWYVYEYMGASQTSKIQSYHISIVMFLLIEHLKIF